MHDTSLAKMRAFVQGYLATSGSVKLDILDVGAQSVDGHATYRPLFDSPDWRYRGLDMAAGANVDIVVADPYRWLELADASVDVVISGQALEHVDYPWRTVAEIARILKPGGVACLIAPSAGPEHRYPRDCWRIYPDGMRALAGSAGLNVVEVFTDWGLMPWQDTFAVLQKPHGDETVGGGLPPLSDLRTALSVYQRALAGRPKSPLYYTTLASCLAAAGDREMAEDALRIGIEACPSAPELRQQLIAGLLTGARNESAMEHALQLLAMRPITPASVVSMGAVYTALGTIQRGHFEALLPAEKSALMRIATLAMAGDRFELAAACWQKLAGSEPGNVSHAVSHAGALLAANRPVRAREQFARARRLQENAREVNRTTVVQHLINQCDAGLYLEIGVESGRHFFQIEAPLKFAVDPRFKIPGGPRDNERERFYSMPSDTFFANPPDEILKQGIDVAFVDGLHTHAQSLRDVENCLRHLNPGGVVVMHDCLPASEAEAAPDMESAKRMPGFKGDWTGDVYRTILALRSRRPDLFVAVLNTDHGVGIIHPGEPESGLALSEGQIESLDFATLDAGRERLLNLKPARWFEHWVQNFPSGSRNRAILGDSIARRP